MLSLVIHTEYKGSDIAKKRHNSCAGFVFFLHEQEYENIDLMRICFYLLLTFLKINISLGRGFAKGLVNVNATSEPCEVSVL